MKIEKIKEHFGIKLSGVDVTSFTEKDKKYLVGLLSTYRVIVVTDHKKLTPDEVVQFSELFSRAWTNTVNGFLVGNREEPCKHPDNNKITLVSSDTSVGVLGTKVVPWHQDISHKPWNSPGGTLPARLLYCDKKASDEDSTTLWLDTTYLYEHCPEPLRSRLESLTAKHKAIYQTDWQGNEMPIVITDPNTGKKGISFNPSFAKEFIGLAPIEVNEIYNQLTEIATREENVITHTWNENDMVICDNYFTSHKRDGLESKEERRLWRVTFQVPELIPKEIYPEVLYED